MPRSLRRMLLTLLALSAVAVAVVSFAAPTPTVRGAKQSGIRLRTTLTAQETLASTLALADSRVQSLIEGRRTELMGVLPVGAQVTEASKSCLKSDCRMVQIYDFDRNATVQAIVDTDKQVVLDVLLVEGSRPGINARLAERAREIAFNAPEVIEALGGKPTTSDWNPMDADLNGTSCSGGHFCVAPSFRIGDYIMWAFVDLTTEEFVGIRWTSPGPDGPIVRTEYPENPEGTCATGILTQNGWTINYETTNSDGLRVYDVSYNGQLILSSAKLAQWHADYGTSGYRDQTGCSPSGGFPIYPIADPFNEPIVENGQTVGVALRQIFSMNNWGGGCQYRYEQRFQFFNDGRFRVLSGAYGKGCGTNSLYRPLVRIDFAAGGTAANDTVERWNGTNWAAIGTETRYAPADVLTNTDHYAYRITDTATGTGFYVEPGGPQFPVMPPAPQERGDNPWSYVVQHKTNEGDTDLGLIGTGCCVDDYHGPEQFINNESTVDQDLVLWWVAQMQTQATAPYYCWTVSAPNDTYPCFSGPMFHPIASQGQPPTAHFMVQGPLAAGVPISFMNHTTGTGPITYNWDFGDGSTSTEMEPTHTYTNPGTYTVTLTATNAGGSDTHTETLVVAEQGQPPAAHFMVQGPLAAGVPISFMNHTTGTGPITYSWDFGDGSTSTEMEPTHTYTNPGTYTVTLTATNAAGSDTHTETLVVSGYMYLPLVVGD